MGRSDRPGGPEAVSVRGQLACATGAAVGTLYGVQGLTAALPSVQEAFQVSGGRLGLFTAAYVAPAVLFAVPLGYLADTLGRRRVFVVAALLWSLAGLAQAWAPDYTTLLALRFVQGTGFGALMPLSVTLIGDALRGARQLRAQAGRQVAMTAGEFAFPLLGAALLAISWRAPIAAQGALLPLALLGAAFLRDASPRRDGSARRGYLSGLGGALREPGMGAVLAAGFLRFWCKAGLIAYAPVLLVQERGASPLQAALVVSFSSLAAALAGTQAVRLLGRAAASQLVVGSAFLMGLGLVGVALAPSWQAALALALLLGLGDGCLMVLQNAIMTETAPLAVRAGLVGVNGMVRNAGKLVAPVAIGAMLLFAPLSAALAAVGCSAWALLPVLRRVRAYDDTLRVGVREALARGAVVE